MPEEPTPKPADKPTTETTFTQAQVDSFVAAERRRITEKFAQFDEFKAKAEKFDALEDGNSSEVDKLTKQVADLNAKMADAEAKSLRAEVAMAKGLTPGQAKRLAGATREELEADADEIIEAFPVKATEGGETKSPPPPSGKPAADLKGGNDPQALPEEMDPAKLAETVPRS
jgi:hypothetical protein